MSPVHTLLRSYPRRRPPLSPRHEAIYVREYQLNRAGGSPLIRIVNALEGWMHRTISASHQSGTILEIVREPLTTCHLNRTLLPTTSSSRLPTSGGRAPFVSG